MTYREQLQESDRKMYDTVKGIVRETYTRGETSREGIEGVVAQQAVDGVQMTHPIVVMAITHGISDAETRKGLCEQVRNVLNAPNGTDIILKYHPRPE